MWRECDGCGVGYEAKRPNSRYHDQSCGRSARRRGGPVVQEAADPAGMSTVVRVRAELGRAGRLETYLGAAALALAERIDASTAVMGFAALVKELRATMDAALAGSERSESDVVDELQAARERRRAAR